MGQLQQDYDAVDIVGFVGRGVGEVGCGMGGACVARAAHQSVIFVLPLEYSLTSRLLILL